MASAVQHCLDHPSIHPSIHPSVILPSSLPRSLTLPPLSCLPHPFRQPSDHSSSLTLYASCHLRTPLTLLFETPSLRPVLVSGH
ncbi:uncharacterized protein BO66DRAFT_139010 [Aspergillus aculeatinus CBS 121060]|uniref:Uncharacterized protein n=1 Tax=Aspergillus aculeatinus CBS 121060 TaxID=1448322 RepID=A0ACD1H2P4_9EURO|nr:hypothetical protein BO66DRAFT_139010 [Aspergillus aculeatinus CBS 121060]RAH67769.1 hypothetical protein BO66DRAFT_139010 [Aspergillus aculeatinus CBS 121060]